MKSTNWRETAELIGIAAIVASLVFVGIQLQQDRDISHRESHSAFVDTRIELARLLAENRETWIEGLKGSPLDEKEQWAFNTLVTVIYFDRYNRYLRRRMGVEIDDDADDHPRLMALMMYQHPGFRTELLAILEGRRLQSEVLGYYSGTEFDFANKVIETLAGFDRDQPMLAPTEGDFL